MRALVEPVHFLFVGARSRALSTLGAIYLLQYFVISGTFAVLISLVKLKGQLEPEGFDDEQVGFTVSLNYGGKATAVLLLLPLFLRWHGHPLMAPLIGLRAGCAVAAVAYVFYPWVRSAPLLYGLTFLEGLDTVWETCLHALTSLLVRSEMQGRVFGGLSFLRTAINLAGPTICNTVWAATVDTAPGITFYLFSAVSAASLLAASALGPLVQHDGAQLEPAEHEGKEGAVASEKVVGGDGDSDDELSAALLPFIQQRLLGC